MPAAESQSAHWLDGSEVDLRTFLASDKHRVVNIGPKRMAKLLEALYAGSPRGVYATMVTEIDDANAFSEQVIVHLPQDEAAQRHYVGSVTQFFKDRGYPEESVLVDKGDPQFLIIDPNPGGSALTVKSDDDE